MKIVFIVLARHLLALAGVATDQVTDQDFAEVLGYLVTAGAIAWSLWEKREAILLENDRRKARARARKRLANILDNN